VPETHAGAAWRRLGWGRRGRLDFGARFDIDFCWFFVRLIFFARVLFTMPLAVMALSIAMLFARWSIAPVISPAPPRAIAPAATWAPLSLFAPSAALSALTAFVPPWRSRFVRARRPLARRRRFGALAYRLWLCRMLRAPWRGRWWRRLGYFNAQVGR
jgi:hypothetical protein